MNLYHEGALEVLGGVSHHDRGDGDGGLRDHDANTNAERQGDCSGDSF